MSREDFEGIAQLAKKTTKTEWRKTPTASSMRLNSLKSTASSII